MCYFQGPPVILFAVDAECPSKRFWISIPPNFCWNKAKKVEEERKQWTDERFRRTPTSKTELDNNGKWFGCMFWGFFFCLMLMKVFFLCAHVFVCERRAEGTGAARKRQLHRSQEWFKIDPDGGKHVSRQTRSVWTCLSPHAERRDWSVCMSAGREALDQWNCHDMKTCVKWLWSQNQPCRSTAWLHVGGTFLGPDYLYQNTSMGC